MWLLDHAACSGVILLSFTAFSRDLAKNFWTSIVMTFCCSNGTLCQSSGSAIFMREATLDADILMPQD
jgi:hypothetical protein